MNQDQVSPATAGKRPSWHALRPWLLLGGFVAVWWILSTGTAQADSTPRVQAHVLETAKGLTHTGPVRHVAGRAHHVTTARHETTPVRDRVKTVSHTTRSTVQVAATSIHEVVRGQLPGVVTKPVDRLLRTAESTVGHAVPGVVTLPESSSTQGNSAHTVSHAKATGASPAVTSTSSWQRLAGTVGAFPFELGARTLAALDKPFRAPFDLPTQAPVSAAFVPFTSILLIGLLDALSLGTRSALQDSRLWRLARLPGGTSYEPGSSPD